MFALDSPVLDHEEPFVLLCQSYVSSPAATVAVHDTDTEPPMYTVPPPEADTLGVGVSAIVTDALFDDLEPPVVSVTLQTNVDDPVLFEEIRQTEPLPV